MWGQKYSYKNIPSYYVLLLNTSTTYTNQTLTFYLQLIMEGIV